MIQTNVFVLASEPVGETDRRYFLLTEELGKIEAVAKAVRKITAKLSGHLEPVNFSWVSLIETRAGLTNGKPSWQIAQALEDESFPKLRADKECLSAALHGAHLLNSLLVEALPEQAIWELWRDFLWGLEKNATKDTASFDRDFFFAQFALRLIFALGFLADPMHCGNCGSVLGKEGAYFSSQQFLCTKCIEDRNASLWFPPESVGVLSVILKKIWLPRSSESERMRTLSERAIYHAKCLML